MSMTVNIYEMPVVIDVIRSAEDKIKKITGQSIRLVPATAIRNINPKVNILISIIENHFGFRWDEIKSKRRGTNYLYARHFFSWISVKVMKNTTAYTGELLGSRDHTTVINSLNCIKEHIKQADQWASELNKICDAYSNSIAEKNA